VIEILVDEYSLDAQKFLRFSGFATRQSVGYCYLFTFDADRPYLHIPAIAERMHGPVVE